MKKLGSKSDPKYLEIYLKSLVQSGYSRFIPKYQTTTMRNTV